MLDKVELQKIRACCHLLPFISPVVVLQLLDEIDQLNKELAEIDAVLLNNVDEVERKFGPNRTESVEYLIAVLKR